MERTGKSLVRLFKEKIFSTMLWHVLLGDSQTFLFSDFLFVCIGWRGGGEIRFKSLFWEEA